MGTPLSKTNRWIACGLLVLSGSLPAERAGAASYQTGWYREVQLSLASDNNISRAWQTTDRIPDNIATVSFGLGHSNLVGNSGKFILSGYLQYSNYARTADLATISTSFGARYIFQTVPGFNHVWYDTAIRLAHLEYRGSAARDGYLLTTKASVNKRMTGRLTGRIGYRFRNTMFAGRSDAERRAGAPFDVSRHEVFVGADYSLAERSWLYGSFSYQHGTFTSSAAGARAPASWDYEASARDAAFEDCVAGNCSTWWAYRYRGNMNAIKLGVAFESHGVDYDLSAQYARVRYAGGHGYHDAHVQLGAVWDF